MKGISLKKLKRKQKQKQKKENLKEIENKTCNMCGKCCLGFHLPAHNLDKDKIRYLCLHKNVEEEQDAQGRPTIYIKNRCTQLGTDNKCKIYETRPKVCKEAYEKNRQNVTFPKGCSLR